MPGSIPGVRTLAGSDTGTPNLTVNQGATLRLHAGSIPVGQPMARWSNWTGHQTFNLVGAGSNPVRATHPFRGVRMVRWLAVNQLTGVRFLSPERDTRVCKLTGKRPDF